MLELDWDEANTEHIARHGLTPADVQHALEHGTVAFDYQDDSGEERFGEIGMTSRGRILYIVTTMRGEVPRVATAFDADEKMKRAYLRGR